MSQRANHRIRRAVAAFAAVAALGAVAAPGANAAAAPWERDPTYGSGGTVHLSAPGAEDHLEAIAAGPGGEAFAIGWTGGPGVADATVAGIRPDGTVDPGFAGGGAVLDLGAYDRALVGGVQPDGKVVIAGSTLTSQNSQMDLWAARYLPSGVLDPSFGSGGVFKMGAPAYANEPHALAFGPHGEIVVLAWWQNLGSDGLDMEVVRLTTRGQLDFDFDGDGVLGVVVTQTGQILGGVAYEYAEQLAVAPDGKILAIGRVALSGADTGMLLVRYNADGTLDKSFGGTGVIRPRPTDDGMYERAEQVHLLPDGSAVVAGTYGPTDPKATQWGWFVARIDPAGGLDTGFGLGAGSVQRNAPNYPAGSIAALLPDGDGGWFAVGNHPSSSAYAAVAHFDAAGGWDTAFGFDPLFGLNAVRVSDGQSWVKSAAVDPQGRIVLGIPVLDYKDEIVVRLRPGDPNPVSGTPTLPAGPTGPPTRTGPGYWMLEENGTVHAFGGVPWLGNGSSQRPPWVDMEPTPSGNGYWLLSGRGDVACLGDASAACGTSGALQPGETAVSLSATPTGHGCWVFTQRGRVMAFGDAASFGDLTSVKLNGPVLDSIPTPTGRGYYMVASDGGIFAFGDARFHGSMGGTRLNKPVQSLVPTPDGAGYWLVAEDGGVFAFNAPFRGSMGGRPLNKPVTGMVPFGNGYLMVGTDGGIFNFSDRPFSGSLGATPPPSPITAVAAAGDL